MIQGDNVNLDIETTSRHNDAKRTDPRGTLIGGDLTNAQLDELWEHWVGEPSDETYMGGWWQDKPHQIGYRLLLRLTRAEDELMRVRSR